MSDTKPLSGWLLASDIDGTLNDKSRRLPKRNYEAIRRFTSEMGGVFILASGRSIESMRKHFNRLDLDSGLCVFTNGAGVYDYAKEEIIWLHEMSGETVRQIKDVIGSFHGANMQVVTPDCIYLKTPTPSSYILALSSKLPKKIFSNYESIPNDRWCKVIFTGAPWRLDRLEKRFAELNGGNTSNLMRSSVCSFEIVAEGTNKGVAVMKVAQMLGIDESKTAAIGDYFNDLEMLKCVALPAVCGQAPKALKKIAKLVTCHCDKGAVADLIEYIIDNYT